VDGRKSTSFTGATPIVCGYATRFMKPHYNQKTGGVEVFLPGAFARSLLGKSAIRFIVDHDEANLVATTADNLELKADRHVLAYRLTIPNSPMGERVAENIKSRTRCEMSVGYHIEVDEFKTIEGASVRFIADASLREITLCKTGAVPGTFAAFDDDPRASLEIKLNGAALEGLYSAERVRTALAQLRAAL